MKEPSTVLEEAEYLFWAQRIFGHVELPDPRLTRRAVAVAAHLAARPADSIPQACGNWGNTKATYRFLENERVTAQALQNSTSKAAVAACRGLGTVYAIQDTTSVNFSALRHTTGLGPIGERGHGHKGEAGPACGIHLHSTLAMSTFGVPLGLLNLDFWVRPMEAPSQREKRKHRPIREKESYRWLTSARAAHQALGALESRPRLVHICDREGDIHELFAELHALGDDAVIRCAQNRAVEGDMGLAHGAVHVAPVLTTTTVDVPRTPKFPARTATVEVRARQVALKGSSAYRKHKPLTLTLVEVWEPAPPTEEQRLLWRLWTTLPATTAAEALEVIRIYKLRWRIEEVHLALKSGCQVEELQLDTRERLCKALTMYMAVAVRIVTLKDLVRQTPEAPCTVAFSTLEWQALWAHKHRRHCPEDTPVPTLREAVAWLAQLGGHLGRKGDGPPGIRTLWRGWRDLQLLVQGYRFHV
jgi:hypothetical protein